MTSFHRNIFFLSALGLSALAAVSCGGSKSAEKNESPTHVLEGELESHNGPSAKAPSARVRQSPPPSGPAKDLQFPWIERSTTKNGLDINTAPWRQLPVVQILLVIKSGGSSDPEQLPGLSQFVASMLKEGTKKHSSEQLARAFEDLGARFGVGSDEDTMTISVHALKDHLSRAMELIAEVVTEPAFADAELAKLKRREHDRLSLIMKDPGFLAVRTLYKELYGKHPYAHVDTTPEAIDKITRAELIAWHKSHILPNNAYFVVVGDVDAKSVQKAAESAFAKWAKGKQPKVVYPDVPVRKGREIILVDRPDSVQSVISIGNLALSRNSPDYLPLLVANQVLGGSPASRLFLDLREKRSLTYGAYSRVGSRVNQAPFVARASVRTVVTGQALEAFMEHLERIISEPIPEPEFVAAKRYISDSFALKVDTPAEIAGLVADLRNFGLADDYWDTYRSKLASITNTQVMDAAKKYIQPANALIVVVGRAVDIQPSLEAFGPVKVIKAESK